MSSILEAMAEARESERWRYNVFYGSDPAKMDVWLGKEIVFSAPRQECIAWLNNRAMAAALLAPCKKFTADEIPDYIAHWLTTIAEQAP